jgi:hypothetical protein
MQSMAANRSITFGEFEKHSDFSRFQIVDEIMQASPY